MSEGKIQLRCGSCGQVNRIPIAKIGEGPRCGGCKEPLHADQPQPVTDPDTFAKVVLQSELPVLVDFWAPWCGPCRMVAPTIEQIAARWAGRLLVVKVDTDQAGELAAEHRIASIPTLAVFSGGREIDRVIGALPPPQLLELAERHAG